MNTATLAAPGAPTRSDVLARLNTAATMHVALTLALIAIATACFLFSAMLGIAVIFFATVILTLAIPAGMPLVIITSFAFQNTVIAAFSPLVTNADAFDLVRGTNFVILVTTFSMFLLAAIVYPGRFPVPALNWLRGALALTALTVFYFALGAVAGAPKDAVIYFRNTFTPIACFFIALAAASQYRLNFQKALILVFVPAALYGYLELIFRFDFLRWFNGDTYALLELTRQIKSGYWEKTLADTGFVLRNLDDIMLKSFFNTPFFEGILPKIFRIQGPNYHSISYAYLLAALSVLTLCRGKWVIALLALPLLVAIGSKGALAFFLFAVLVKLGLAVMHPRTVLNMFIALTVVWACAIYVVGMANADYHVLGLNAGLEAFAKFPLGHGLGLGGNLSSGTPDKLDWDMAQKTGSAAVPVESALGVMLNQMGPGTFIYFGFLIALAVTCRRLFLATGQGQFLFGFIAVIMSCVNAAFQEEAVYSPLALGLCLVIVGVSLGEFYRGRAKLEEIR